MDQSVNAPLIVIGGAGLRRDIATDRADDDQLGRIRPFGALASDPPGQLDDE